MIHDKVNNSAQSIFGVIAAKILISMSKPYLIIYYKNQYPYNKNGNVLKSGGENLVRKNFRIFPTYSENRKRTQFP